jgi:hypothetical protein
MDESTGWSARRYLTLIIVVALHAALLVLLLAASRARTLPMSSVSAVQLVLLAPDRPPRLRIARVSVRPLSGATSITITQPVTEIPSLAVASTAGGSSNGDGSDVDWAAEARRALRAFEIRNHQALPNKSVSRRPEEENWLPNALHRSGEQFRTANGDWMVWINANCYQIASSASSAYTLDATLSQIICRHPSAAAQ